MPSDHTSGNRPSLASMAPEDSNLAACPPGHLPEGFAHSAEEIHTVFLGLLDAGLTRTLETPTTSTTVGTGQSTFQEFTESHQSAGCLIALDLAPLGGCAVLSFSREMLFSVLKIFTAAPASAEYSPREAVTGIELHILQDFFDVFAKSLRKAWQPLYPLSFTILAMGAEKVGEAVAGQEAQTVVTMKSRCQLGEVEAGFDLAFPGFLLRFAGVNAKRGPVKNDAPEQVQKALAAALRQAVLRVDAVLHGSGVRMSELLKIRPGQILSLGAPPDTMFDCLVNGASRFKGAIIASGNRQAFRVEALDSGMPQSTVPAEPAK